MSETAEAEKQVIQSEHLGRRARTERWIGFLHTSLSVSFELDKSSEESGVGTMAAGPAPSLKANS